MIRYALILNTDDETMLRGEIQDRKLEVHHFFRKQRLNIGLGKVIPEEERHNLAAAWEVPACDTHITYRMH